MTTEKQQICGTHYHLSTHSFSFQSIKCFGNLTTTLWHHQWMHNKCTLLITGSYNCHIIYIIIKTDKMTCHSYQTSAYVTCKFMHYQCTETGIPMITQKDTIHNTHASLNNTRVYPAM